MSFLARFRRKKQDPEVTRRRMLLQSGRLGEATIFETSTDGDGQMTISYSYTVGGVDYRHSNASTKSSCSERTITSRARV